MLRSQSKFYKPLAFFTKKSWGLHTELGLRHLFSESYNSGGIQLTATGNLNRKLIIEIYEKRYLPDEHIDNGIVKLRSEKDWICLHGVHIVLKLAGFMRKRNNKLTLSQKRKVQFEKGKMSEIFFEFLQAYTTRFNWGYNDLYENDQIGQMGFLYLMYLFQKYGNDFRDLRYYCKRYYRAFPLLYIDDNLSGGLKYGKSENIVNIRFVERFAKWFGFVESRERKNDQFRYQKEVKLRVTELLSNLLIIRRQQGIQKEHT